MREAGSQNVLIVEPLGASFAGYPGGLVDPLDRILFGIHTYFDQVGTTREEWDRRFGDFAASHPLLVTEWTETSQPLGGNERRKPPWCEIAPMTRPLEMLHYFEEKGIDGVVAWAFDLPGTFVADLEGTPRTLTGFACGERGGGIGDLFQDYFQGTLPPLPPR